MPSCTEIEHVRRGDWLLHVLVRVVCAAYWFHPLAWVALRHLHLAVERACDDAVLGRAESAPYATQLVRLAERLSGREPRPLVAMAGRSDLSARVRAVLDRTQVRRRAGRIATVAAFAGAAVCLLGLAPLTAERALTLAAPAASQSGSSAASDPERETPGFEVASVKRNTSGARLQQGGSGTGGVSIGVRRGTTTFAAINVPVRDIIRYAYELEPFQPLDAAPGWLDDRYDIVAKLPEPDLPPGGVRRMLQKLLAERFQLSIRWDVRERPVQALVLARRDGPLASGIARSTTDCEAWHAARHAWITSGSDRDPSPDDWERYVTKPSCDMVQQPFAARLHAGAVTMRDFTRFLSRLPAVASPVVDRTGLSGVFDIEVRFAPAAREVPPADAGSVEPSLPSLAVALEEQLGLRLERIRGAVDVLVIERIERPTED